MKKLILSCISFPATQLDLLDSVPVFVNIAFEVVSSKETLPTSLSGFSEGDNNIEYELVGII